MAQSTSAHSPPGWVLAWLAYAAGHWWPPERAAEWRTRGVPRLHPEQRATVRRVQADREKPICALAPRACQGCRHWTGGCRTEAGRCHVPSAAHTVDTLVPDRRCRDRNRGTLRAPRVSPRTITYTRDRLTRQSKLTARRRLLWG